MTKDFQQELLEKVRKGVKPSDLKKDSKKPAKNPLSPSPIEISQGPGPKPVKKPLQNHDEGYQSDPLLTPTPSEDRYSSTEEERELLTPNPTISKNQTKTPSSRYVLDLEKQVKALQRQLQVYKDFKEADLKIKEQQKKQIEQLTRANSNLKAGMDRLSKVNEQLSKSVRDLEQKNQELNKTITGLQNQEKNTREVKQTKETGTQTEKTFTLKNYSCQICFEERKGGIPSQFIRVKGLGGERNKKI
jgi:myosin heavy subunit